MRFCIDNKMQPAIVCHMPQDNRTAGGLDQAMRDLAEDDFDYEAACAAEMRAEFLAALHSGKKSDVTSTCGACDLQEVVCDLMNSAQPEAGDLFQEQQAIFGLCAAGQVLLAVPRAKALAERLADAYIAAHCTGDVVAQWAKDAAASAADEYAERQAFGGRQ